MEAVDGVGAGEAADGVVSKQQAVEQLADVGAIWVVAGQDEEGWGLSGFASVHHQRVRHK